MKWNNFNNWPNWKTNINYKKKKIIKKIHTNLISKRNQKKKENKILEIISRNLFKQIQRVHKKKIILNTKKEPKIDLMSVFTFPLKPWKSYKNKHLHIHTLFHTATQHCYNVKAKW